VNAEQARAALLAAITPDGPLAMDNFVLGGEAIEGAEVSRIDLTEGLAAQVRGDVTKSADSLIRKQIIPYDPSYQTNSSQVLVEDLASIPALAAVDAVIRNGDVPSYPGGALVVAMAHAVGVDERQIVSYRLKGAGIATRRARGWIQLVPRDGIYEPIKGEVLFYEPRFDALTCAGYAFFTTATLIQTKLQADTKARQLAKATLATVTKTVAIAGLADLEEAVMDDPNMRAKLASIARLLESDPGYAQLLTTERLVRFIQENPEYDIPIGQVDGKPALLFNPAPQHRHQIPKLLADDYLHSQLTDRNYEAGSKQRLQG
jgi:hypothetical protein